MIYSSEPDEQNHFKLRNNPCKYMYLFTGILIQHLYYYL
jgi:hypothetical protein